MHNSVSIRKAGNKFRIVPWRRELYAHVICVSFYFIFSKFYFSQLVIPPLFSSCPVVQNLSLISASLFLSTICSLVDVSAQLDSLVLFLHSSLFSSAPAVPMPGRIGTRRRRPTTRELINLAAEEFTSGNEALRLYTYTHQARQAYVELCVCSGKGIRAYEQAVLVLSLSPFC